MAGVHDQIFKELIADFPKNFLTLVMPDVASRIDLSDVVFEPGDYFLDSPRGKRRAPDLTAKVRSRASPCEEALIHVEIEYEFREARLVRFLEYNRLLAMRYGVPVHTVVIYLHGGPPGIQTVEHWEVSFEQELTLFRFKSWGLSRTPAPAYLARPEPLAWAFAALMHLGSLDSRTELGLACLRRIAAVRDLDEVRRFRLFNCVATYIELDTRATEEYETLLGQSENLEVQEMMMTWAEKMEAKGREEGLAEGRKSVHDLVLRLLSQRFGTLPAGIKRRIEAISSVQELTRLAESVLKVDSLEELELGS